MATIDIKLQNLCDHQVVGELLSLGDDRRTLRLHSPVASTSSIYLTRNDEPVPPSGYSVSYETRNVLGIKFAVLSLRSYEMTEDALYEVSYVTTPELCPKCSGCGYVDDLCLDPSGSPLVVEDTALLAQSVEKIAITRQGSNKYHPWFGSRLDMLVNGGVKITDDSMLLSDVKSALADAIRSLQDAQTHHMNVNSNVSSHEVLGRVLSIDAKFSEEDPGIVLADVSYESRSGKVVNFTQELELSSLRGR